MSQSSEVTAQDAAFKTLLLNKRVDNLKKSQHQAEELKEKIKEMEEEAGFLQKHMYKLQAKNERLEKNMEDTMEEMEARYEEEIHKVSMEWIEAIQTKVLDIAGLKNDLRNAEYRRKTEEEAMMEDYAKLWDSSTPNADYDALEKCYDELEEKFNILLARKTLYKTKWAEEAEKNSKSPNLLHITRHRLDHQKSSKRSRCATMPSLRPPSPNCEPVCLPFSSNVH